MWCVAEPDEGYSQPCGRVKTFHCFCQWKVLQAVGFSDLSFGSVAVNGPDFKQGDTIFACFGESTAKKLEELGFRVDIKVAQGQGQSMASTIEDFLIAQKG